MRGLALLVALPAKAAIYPHPSFPRRRESSRRASAKTGRGAPRLPVAPGATSFPRKREPTGRRTRPYPRLRQASVGSWIPAYAGMTMGGLALLVALPAKAAIYPHPSFPRRRESSRRDRAMTRRRAPRRHYPQKRLAMPAEAGEPTYQDAATATSAHCAPANPILRWIYGNPKPSAGAQQTRTSGVAGNRSKPLKTAHLGLISRSKPLANRSKPLTPKRTKTRPTRKKEAPDDPE